MKKLSNFPKRLLAMICALLTICCTAAEPAYATENSDSSDDIGILAADSDKEKEVKAQLTPRQYYVYQLKSILLDQQYCMLSNLGEDYFDEKTGWAVWDVFNFNHFGTALKGSDAYEQEYYCLVMTNCITMGGTDGSLAQEIKDLPLKDISEKLSAFSEESERFFGLISDGLDWVNMASDAGIYIMQVSNYSDSYLRALCLLEDQGCGRVGDDNMWLSADSVVRAATSTEAKEKYSEFFYKMLDEADNYSAELVFDILTGGISSAWKAALSKVKSPDEVENEVAGMYYMKFQNGIALTVDEECPVQSYKSDFSDEYVRNLVDLTMLYLKCGAMGYAAEGEDDMSSACLDQLALIRQTEIPELEDTWE